MHVLKVTECLTVQTHPIRVSQDTFHGVWVAVLVEQRERLVDTLLYFFGT